MASPNKNMKEAGDYSQSFEGGVGGYTPYEMKGHELPGIKQRSPNTMQTFGVDDSENPESIATSPGKFTGGVGSSPAKLFGGAWKAAKNLFKKKEAAPEPPAAAAEAGGGDGSHTHGASGEVVPPVENPLAPIDLENPAAPPVEGGVTPPEGKVFNPLSDIRAKEKIERTGKSPSGIPMYEFNYIGGSNRYSGVMAQDLLEMNIDAVSLGDDGYYRVNYNNIDVDMHQIN